MTDKVKERLSFLINAAYIFVLVLLVYLTFKYIISWIFPFVLAFCIVSLVHPVIRRIKRWLNIRQEVISIAVMVLIYALVGVLIFFLILQVIFLVRDALLLLPDYYSQTVQPSLLKLGESFSAFVRELPPQWQQQLTIMQGEFLRALQSFLLNISQKGISLLSSLTSSVPAFLIALVFTIMLSFFISVQYERVIGFIKSQLPLRAAALASDTRLILADTVFKYIKASLTLAFITFIELSTGLLLLGRKNAIAIAAGIAVFDALPFFGTGAIVLPWAVIELIQGNYPIALGLLVMYGFVAFMRSIIEPKVVGDKLGLNPIVSLMSIYLGFKVFGVLGMICMPILTQIILTLHKSGSIKLFRETVAADVPAASSEQEPSDGEE